MKGELPRELNPEFFWRHRLAAVLLKLVVVLLICALPLAVLREAYENDDTFRQWLAIGALAFCSFPLALWALSRMR